jgi:hypothetical protein
LQGSFSQGGESWILVNGVAAIDVLVGMVERNEMGLPEQPITTLAENCWNPPQTIR